MGFLDTLKEIGFGNRGPSGYQQTGASYLSERLRGLTQRTTETGLSQALVEASKEGKIPFEKMVEISEKYRAPLREVIARSNEVNTQVEAQHVETFGKQVLSTVKNWRKANPDTKLNEKIAMQLMDQAGAKSVEDHVLGLAVLQKAYGSSGDIKQLDPSKRTVREDPFGNLETIAEPMTQLEDKKIVVKPGESVINTDGEVIFSLPREAKIKEAKTHVLKPGEILVNEAGKTIKEHPLKKAEGKATDFESAYQQKISQSGFEYLTRDEFRTKYWTAQGGALTDNAAYERLQEYANTVDPAIFPILTKDYEELRKNGMSRNDAMNEVTNKDYKVVKNMVFKSIGNGQWQRVK